MAIKALLGFDHYPQNDTTWIAQAPAVISRPEAGNGNFRDRVVDGWVRTLQTGSADSFNRIQFSLASYFQAPVDTIVFGIRLRCDVPPASTSRVLYTPWSGVDLIGTDLGGAVTGRSYYVELKYTFSTDQYSWIVDGVVVRSGVTGSPTRAVVIGLRTAIYQTTERWSLKDVVVTDDQGTPVGPLGPRSLVLIDAATGTYRADQLPTPLSLRAIRGYAMTTPPAQMSLRSVVGYAMASVPTPLPQGVTGKQAVTNMVLARSKKTRPASDFDIETPNVRTGDEYFNSTVKVIAQPASGLLGSTVFRYNRVPLDRMNLASNSFDLGTATSIHALIPAINAASGMILTTDDIEDGVIEPAAATTTLRSKPGSWWFLPNSTLVIGKILTSINVPISSDTIDW